jgi:truncated hemoglobin YjbI
LGVEIYYVPIEGQDRGQVVPEQEKPFTAAEYERMAKELEDMAAAIRLKPEMNHHFAERLILLAKQMREDKIRAHPPQKA